MKTITGLTGSVSAAAVAQAHIQPTVSNTQSKKGFWRRIRHSKNLITAESSTGGLAQISTDDLWTLLESADPNLKPPE